MATAAGDRDWRRRPLPEEAGIVPEVSATRSHVRPLRVSEDQSHPMAAGACLRAAAPGEYRHRLLGRRGVCTPEGNVDGGGTAGSNGREGQDEEGGRNQR